MKLSKEQVRWILLAQCGDKSAFNELLQSIQQPLYRYISKLTCDKDRAEDILQDVFVLIYRKLVWLRDPQLFFPWMYRIATRETFSALKKEKSEFVQVQDEKLLESIPDLSQTEEQHLEECFPKLLQKVSPASRAVLFLHYSEEMPLQEISEVLGIALGTVKSRLSYGLTLLREMLQSKEGLSDFSSSSSF